MLTFERVGDFNPQLMRELKSRLSWRNSLISVFISVVAQILLLLSYYSKLPQDRRATYLAQDYCVAFTKSGCAVDSLGHVLIRWPKWWAEVAYGSSWLLIYGLVLGGVYLLASSLAQEEKRGTLDFIRLTPQKASAIFVGKLLGVPILVYLGVALALPLQFYGAQQAGISRFYVLSWDLLMVFVAVMLYMGSMLATMWFKAQSILLTTVACVVTYPVISLSLHWYKAYGSNYAIGRNPNWYTLLFGNHLFFYWSFIALTAIGIYWLYQALERRYLQPKSIVLSKGQSYLWSLLFNLFLLGFNVSETFAGNQGEHWSFTVPFQSSSSYGDAVVAVFGFAWLLLLIPMLLPSRQSLVEWSRHSHLHPDRMLHSLLWQDKSPGTLAVAVNVGIASLVWLVACATRADFKEILHLLLGAVITITLATIYSSIAHWILFWPVNNRPAWIIGILGGLIFLPLIGAAVVPGSKDLLNLLSLFLWNSIGNAMIFGVLFIWGLQLAVLAWLTAKLRRVLTKAGRSASYQNFAS
jgi:hypothetical protein